jgi:protein gp37
VEVVPDIFETLSFEQIAAVFGVMAASPQHTFQVLTKRPARALEFFAWVATNGGLGPYIRSDEGRAALRGIVSNEATLRTEVYRGKRIRSATDGWATVMNAAACHYGRSPLPNVWLGVSVEDQPTADQRIPLLLQCPAAVRFVSYEPALAAVDFARWLARDWSCKQCGTIVSELIDGTCPLCEDELQPFRVGLDQVIVGGESGPGARPFDVAWARETVRQCREAGVPCFVKQLGARPRIGNPQSHPEDFKRPHDLTRLLLRDRKGGDWSEWPEDLRVREYPAAIAAEPAGKGA